MSQTYALTGKISEPVTISVDPKWYKFTATAKFFADKYLNNEVTPKEGAISITGLISDHGGKIPFDSSPLDVSKKSAFATAGVPLLEITSTPKKVSGNSVKYYTLVVVAEKN